MTDGPGPPVAPQARADAQRRDGGRRRVVVSPDQVWSAPGAPSAPQDPVVARREARRGFHGVVVLVIGLSCVLMLAALVAVGVLLRFAR